jgi:hypothetical protein
MIGIWNTYSDLYLYIMGAAMLVFFGIPLLVTPSGWAKMFHWEIPQSKELVVALGREMGLIISLIAIFAFKVVGVPGAKPFFFDFILWLLATMGLLHIYGAIRKTQPITENIEIALWVVLFVLTLCFYPA